MPTRRTAKEAAPPEPVSAAAPASARSATELTVDRLEKLCLEKGLRMTDQRRIIARVLS